MRTNHNASGKPSLEGCVGLRYPLRWVLQATYPWVCGILTRNAVYVFWILKHQCFSSAQNRRLLNAADICDTFNTIHYVSFVQSFFVCHNFFSLSLSCVLTQFLITYLICRFLMNAKTPPQGLYPGDGIS